MSSESENNADLLRDILNRSNTIDNVEERLQELHRKRKTRSKFRKRKARSRFSKTDTIFTSEFDHHKQNEETPLLLDA